MIEIPIEDALEVSRHNEPQVGPQEWECGCLTEVFVTDRDHREDEEPFEMRLTKWCETDCQPWGMAQAGRVYRECDRYGLPHSAGALLRHIYNNRDAAFGFKDLSIELLEGKLADAESREIGLHDALRQETARVTELLGALIDAWTAIHTAKAAMPAGASLDLLEQADTALKPLVQG